MDLLTRPLSKVLKPFLSMGAICFPLLAGMWGIFILKDSPYLVTQNLPQGKEILIILGTIWVESALIFQVFLTVVGLAKDVKKSLAKEQKRIPEGAVSLWSKKLLYLGIYASSSILMWWISKQGLDYTSTFFYSWGWKLAAAAGICTAWKDVIKWGLGVDYDGEANTSQKLQKLWIFTHDNLPPEEERPMHNYLIREEGWLRPEPEEIKERETPYP